MNSPNYTLDTEAISGLYHSHGQGGGPVEYVNTEHFPHVWFSTTDLNIFRITRSCLVLKIRRSDYASPIIQWWIGEYLRYCILFILWMLACVMVHIHIVHINHQPNCCKGSKPHSTIGKYIKDGKSYIIQGGKVSRRPSKVTFRRLKETNSWNKRRPLGDQLLSKRRLFDILDQSLIYSFFE